jgi:hypothetical protein
MTGTFGGSPTTILIESISDSSTLGEEHRVRYSLDVDEWNGRRESRRRKLAVAAFGIARS